MLRTFTQDDIKTCLKIVFILCLSHSSQLPAWSIAICYGPFSIFFAKISIIIKTSYKADDSVEWLVFHGTNGASL